MFRLFRRNEEDDDEFEYVLEPEPRAPRPQAAVPDFALVVAASGTDGWHMAAVIGQAANPDFYVRALTVRWPFLIARPAPSTRTSDRRVDRAQRSPTGTTPAKKLVVNWAWETVEDPVSQLRFYVKRAAPRLFPASGGVTVRLTLKESGWPRRRIVVRVKSNHVTWNAPGTPASLPAKSSGTAPP